MAERDLGQIRVRLTIVLERAQKDEVYAQQLREDPERALRAAGIEDALVDDLRRDLRDALDAI